MTNPNIIKDGQAVIHQYTRQNYYDLLLTLLLYSEDPPVDINIADQICGDTPLHIAVEVKLYLEMHTHSNLAMFVVHRMKMSKLLNCYWCLELIR